MCSFFSVPGIRFCWKTCKDIWNSPYQKTASQWCLSYQAHVLGAETSEGCTWQNHAQLARDPSVQQCNSLTLQATQQNCGVLVTADHRTSEVGTDHACDVLQATGRGVPINVWIRSWVPAGNFVETCQLEGSWEVHSCWSMIHWMETGKVLSCWSTNGDWGSTLMVQHKWGLDWKVHLSMNGNWKCTLMLENEWGLEKYTYIGIWWGTGKVLSC